MDADEPGEALGEEIMRRVGRAKCYHLELPEGCKDANDTLREHGADYLAELIDCAVPTPLVGVYSADDYGEDVASFTNWADAGQEHRIPVVSMSCTLCFKASSRW